MDRAGAFKKRNSRDTPEGVQGEDSGKIRRPEGQPPACNYQTVATMSNQQQQQQRKGSGSKRPSTRLPFHPRRTPRKQPRLQLEERDTTSMMTDVLELTASPIADPAIEAVMTPPPTVSPEVAGAKFCWPEPLPAQPTPPLPAQPSSPLPAQPSAPLPTQTTPPLPAQPTPPLPAQPIPPLPSQLLTLPTAQPIVWLRALPAAQASAQPAVRPLAQPATRPRASKARKPIRPIRPLTPTIITILDSNEEPARSRYDPVVQREVPMTPGRGLSLEERPRPPPPPPPPGPKLFDELIGVAWPNEVSQAARALNPRRRRIRVVWSGGVRYKLKAGQGRIRAFRERQIKQSLTQGQSSLVSRPLLFVQFIQSLLCQDTHQSLLLRDHVFSPCSARTFINPCCCGIKSSVLALSGHSSILAAAGSSLQSLLCQDIHHQSLLLRDQVFSPCFCQDTHQSLLLRDHVFSPCSVRTLINPCCCGIKSSVLALSGHSSILAAAGSSLQSLLCQDTHQSLLLRDHVFSPCSARTFISPCCCGITSSVLALPGHSSVLAAAGSSLQSLLCQDIHRSLLLRDHVFSPCSARTFIDPCCCGIKSSVLALSGHSSILAAAGPPSLLCQDIHQSLLLRDHVSSPCSVRTFIDPCCCGIQPPVLALSGHSSILADAGSSLLSLLWQDHQQPLLIRVGHQEVAAAGSVLCPDRETREAEGAEGKRSLKDEQRRKNPS
ncbi:hypothetical protein ACLKA7_017659 [Drosophila subpalustris]